MRDRRLVLGSEKCACVCCNRLTCTLLLGMVLLVWLFVVWPRCYASCFEHTSLLRYFAHHPETLQPKKSDEQKPGHPTQPVKSVMPHLSRRNEGHRLITGSLSCTFSLLPPSLQPSISLSVYLSLILSPLIPNAVALTLSLGGHARSPPRAALGSGSGRSFIFPASVFWTTRRNPCTACVSVYVSICMYVSMYVCIYVCTYVAIDESCGLLVVYQILQQDAASAVT
ncbi:hypothetical protein BD289DRAFT_108904 [Coniella lustricola]|uniref:Uncharacterized protein n=1 Tax=Coniella lustricola TaxID=2025994 RepID=A0A2T2ZXL7_9PEZI|nr:hypothetical protein BD289DRAFT_108904 [Coniella lustricola]